MAESDVHQGVSTLNWTEMNRGINVWRAFALSFVSVHAHAARAAFVSGIAAMDVQRTYAH